MPSRLRIGVNALYLIPGGVGGTEIYLRNLLAALAEIDTRNQYIVYVNRETGLDLCPPSPNFAPYETNVKATFRPGRLLWEQTGLAREANAAKLDVLFNPGFTMPYFGSGARVTVIHDLQHRRQPQNFGWLELRAWELLVRMSIRSSRAIITVSESSRRDIVELYGRDESSISVIGHGVEESFFGLREDETFAPSIPSSAGLPDCRYLLAVSTVHPHKNWKRLLQAFATLRKEGMEHHLAICGLPGKSSGDLAAAIRELSLGDAVHILGWQPRRTLIGLFKFAEALVFPSTFEGFGMPVAEALAGGLPVVCSDIPPLRGTADGCAAFFDPESDEALADALRSTLADSEARAERVEAGLERAKGFTWRRAAERTLRVFLEAARA
ncbi:MAG: glycosyltransferase family 4 protein [Acidobacteria bacterium]|nr:glycosyltransferase family 4 protein [Acidobacteriota bacterium]